MLYLTVNIYHGSVVALPRRSVPSSIHRGFLRLCLCATHPSHLVPCSGSSSSTSACRSAEPSLKNVTVLTAEGRGRAHSGRRPSVYSGAASTTMPRACVLFPCGYLREGRRMETRLEFLRCLPMCVEEAKRASATVAGGSVPLYFPVGSDLRLNGPDDFNVD
jgi:hypothetical protein